MPPKKLLHTLSALALFSASPCLLACTAPSGVWGLAVNVNGGAECGITSSETAEGLINLIDTNGLQSIAPSYQATSQAAISINFNSVPMTGTFSTNSPVLQVQIPVLGVNQTFNGATREESGDLFLDYLKDNGIIGKIMNYQARNSANSPITGQGGLIPSAIAADFDQNFNNVATQVAAPASVATQQGTNNLIGVSAQYTNLERNGITTNVTTLPLTYSIRNDIDPRRQLILSVPISVADVNGARSFHLGAGVAYRKPMNDNWTLTPSFKYSLVGSKDLATVAGLYSISVTSAYLFDLPDYDIAIGNMVSYNKTAKFSAGDYAFDPDISTLAIRNGVMLSQPVVLQGKKMTVEYSLIDTRYLGGDRPFASNSQELGITLGTNKNAFYSGSYLRGGLTYITAKGSRGFTANVGYWF